MQIIRHSPSKSTSTVNSDPFYDSPSSSLIHMAQMQMVYPRPGEVGRHRSPELVFLTSTSSGLPFFSVAMNPAHFPFVDSARQHKPVNHGVIKIRNVRRLLIKRCRRTLTGHGAKLDSTDSFLYSTHRGHRVPRSRGKDPPRSAGACAHHHGARDQQDHGRVCRV